MTLDLDDALKKDILYRTAFYWLAKRFGKNMNLYLEGAMLDIPKSSRVEFNTVGDDVIITVIGEEE